ncbi:SgcJ/EcaC family oxidoreductase [Microlunatus speluncae]|uniref:SgcJ/EcaC family oxidoreductase n=1 Tax=Microlunatus speluncae TaxID=2594267 RepID=UPI00126667BF|nr:SgcJ/EcaC family oxidoreductase [Microlunatus speluncae]
MDQDQGKLHRLVEELQAAQFDVEPFLALHTEDAIIVNFGGRRVAGRDELGRAMAAGLASPLAQVITTAEVDDIRFLRPDVAIISCTKHISDERDTAEPSFATTGRLTYVAVEEAGAWRVALAQTTPVAGS